MLIAILGGIASGETLKDYERFSYAVGALGLAMFFSNQLCQHFPNRINRTNQVLLTLCFYPLMLLAINTAVEHSPKLITEANRPIAMQRGVKRLSGPTAADLNFVSQLSSTIKRFPIPDKNISELYLDSIKGISQLIQHKDNWSQGFTEEQLKKPIWGLFHQNRNYHVYEDDLAYAYYLNVLTSPILPMTSKLFTQIGHLARVDKSMLLDNEPIVNLLIMSRLGLIDSAKADMSVLNDFNRAKRQEYSTNKRVLLQFEKNMKAQSKVEMFDVIDYQQGWTVLDSVKRSFTLHILTQAGLNTKNLPENIIFPFRNKDQPYHADAEFIKLTRWYAPFLFDKKNRLIIPLQDLESASQIKRYEAMLSKKLPDSYKNNFYHFYYKTAIELSNTPTTWQLPIAMPLYGHFVRIGRVLEWVLIITLVLLVFKIICISLQVKYGFFKASATVVAAFLIFLTPLLHWIMQPVLWFSF
ncbi:hypothetical protein [Rheinheimera sp. UJ63]|uniref:hypothetical protein n=1 Tax=Rheinheimera sp. UJ63 TaxID=2910157 RepID=UPI001F23F061|nr:hypothetical protein [Rheinheimera sp. UJ63]MCF4010666.1 hypothetical protein [Rheinheimera sp. UJ63]